MLQSLKKLFANDRPARPLFEAIVAEARRPFWYVEGGVPDTVEGRFAMLALLTALVVLRLERGGDEARRASVALTECFIDEMDGEVRQMGIGDPTLSKQVGGMVGALGRRVGRFRELLASGGDWQEAVNASLYRGAVPGDSQQRQSLEAVRALWASLDGAGDSAVLSGQWR